MASQDTPICTLETGHAGPHEFHRVGDGWNAYARCGHRKSFVPKTIVQPSHLRDLAQYLLAASVQLQNGTLAPAAISQLREWTHANDLIRQLTGEFAGSVAAQVAKRAIGMLTKQQLSRDFATTECAAMLTVDEPLIDLLADAKWEDAAECLSRLVIDAYLSALVEGQL